MVMVSAFTRRGGQVTIDALQAGAFDFVAKPSGASVDENIATLRAELLGKIRALPSSQLRWAPGTATVAVPARAAAGHQAVAVSGGGDRRARCLHRRAAGPVGYAAGDVLPRSSICRSSSSSTCPQVSREDAGRFAVAADR